MKHPHSDDIAAASLFGRAILTDEYMDTPAKPPLFGDFFSSPSQRGVDFSVTERVEFCQQGRKGMLIGYARVSTDDQRLDLQRDALVKEGVEAEWIYDEYVSGAKTARPQLENCMKALRKGDTLVVYRLDRLGRNLRELIDILEHLDSHEIGFKSLTESIDTTTPSGRLVFHIFGAVAQFERDVISERTKAGLKAARARGARGGRKPKLDAKKVKQIEILLQDQTVTMDDVAKLMNVSRPTIYRALERKRNEEWAKRKALEDKRKGKK